VREHGWTDENDFLLAVWHDYLFNRAAK